MSYHIFVNIFVHSVNKSQQDGNTSFNGSLVGWYELEHFLLDKKKKEEEERKQEHW